MLIATNGHQTGKAYVICFDPLAPLRNFFPQAKEDLI